MCSMSSKGCQEHALKGLIYKMDRSIKDLDDLSKKLAGAQIDTIRKVAGDYSIRGGLCHPPITVTNLCEAIPVMHAKIKVSTPRPLYLPMMEL